MANKNELQRVVFRMADELAELKRKAAKANPSQFMSGRRPSGHGPSRAQRQLRELGIRAEHIRRGARRAASR